jgi:hypothetical protein
VERHDERFVVVLIEVLHLIEDKREADARLGGRLADGAEHVTQIIGEVTGVRRCSAGERAPARSRSMGSHLRGPISLPWWRVLPRVRARQAGRSLCRESVCLEPAAHGQPVRDPPHTIRRISDGQPASWADAASAGAHRVSKLPPTAGIDTPSDP